LYATKVKATYYISWLVKTQLSLQAQVEHILVPDEKLEDTKLVSERRMD
jgi:hypothetical protein